MTAREQLSRRVVHGKHRDLVRVPLELRHKLHVLWQRLRLRPRGASLISSPVSTSAAAATPSLSGRLLRRVLRLLLLVVLPPCTCLV